VRVTGAPGMVKWRNNLYVTTSRLTTDPVEFLGLPHERTIVMGAEIEI
jgi:KUP system potassium uptake protein